MRPLLFCLALLTVFSLRSTANALPIPFRLAEVSQCLGRTTDCELGSQQSISSGATDSIAGSFGSEADQAQMTGTASAVSLYGSLGVASSNTINITGSPALSESVGDASFQDNILVSFAPFTGSEGFLAVNYTLDGFSSASGSANSFARVKIEVINQAGLDQQYTANLPSSASGVYGVPLTFTFVYGDPFTLRFDLLTATGTITPGPAGVGFELTEGAGSGTAATDYFNTLTLAGLHVTDANGNPVDGVTFTSDSGTLYTQDGVELAAPTPEPSSVVLAVLGLTAGAVRVRMRVKSLRNP